MDSIPKNNSLESMLFSLTGKVNGVGVIFLAFMMIVTTMDVLSRFLLNLPITGSIEITEFLLVLTILMGIPYAASRKQHVSIDILTTRLSWQAKLLLENINLFIGLALMVVLVWCNVEHALLMSRMQRVTAVLRIPIMPFVFMVAFGFGLTGLVWLGKLLHNIRTVSDWRQISLWIMSALLVILLFYMVAIYSRDLSLPIGPVIAGLIGLVLLFVAFLSGLPIFTSLILVGFLGMSYLRGSRAGLSVMGASAFSTVSDYTFSTIPLFVLMGEFCFFSGIGKDLYETAHKWVGSIRGGLSMGTVGACGGFAAVCGDSMATAVTMGTISIPEMIRYKYDSKLAAGCVAAGGTLGVLIPPSLAFILYALLADQSISALFIAGILPGILLILLFMITIYMQTLRNPQLGPPGPRRSIKEKITSLKGIWTTLMLFTLVIGGMYFGVFTPTEGGGIGAFGALIIGVFRRRLNWKGIQSSLLEAGKISSVCIGILIGAKIFGYFLASSKIPMVLAGFVTALPVPPIVILISILFIYLLLGCIMPAIPMLILTVPIFYPVVTKMGYDPIWFGVIMVLMFEMAVITPPMGINVLALQTVVENISVGDMFRGIIPFLAAMILCVIILTAFPDIVLFLPQLLGR